MDFNSYLRHEKIVVDDPYDQENLRAKSRVEVGKNAAVFDNYYQVRGEKIYCHICGGHRHFKGITGVLDDGSRILFGRKCAVDYFGPEVARLHAKELRRRTSDAQARFKILTIQGELESIERWLNSYRQLVTHLAQSWIEISTRYPNLYSEIMNHLSKNSGRLVHREIVELDRPNGGIERVFSDKILVAIRYPEAIPYLTRLAQQLSLVDVFIEAVSNLNHQPNQKSIKNLNRMFLKMVGAATIIDQCLSFTHDFFNPEKIKIVNQWAESRRKGRLGEQTETTNRNLVRLFSKIVGRAVPLPAKPLRDTILQVDSMQNLAKENKDEIEKISQS